METQLFRSQGKKWAVTVVKTTLVGYHPGSKAPRRKAVVAVLRHAYTGEPFTGIAILSPKDKDNDFEAAKKLAIKRAIRASFMQGYGCSCYVCRRDYFNEMWRAYRLSVMRSTDPMKWAVVITGKAATITPSLPSVVDVSGYKDMQFVPVEVERAPIVVESTYLTEQTAS
jgi:hypothetical protein